MALDRDRRGIFAVASFCTFPGWNCGWNRGAKYNGNIAVSILLLWRLIFRLGSRLLKPISVGKVKLISARVPVMGKGVHALPEASKVCESRWRLAFRRGARDDLISIIILDKKFLCASVECFMIWDRPAIAHNRLICGRNGHLVFVSRRWVQPCLWRKI